MKVPLTWLEEFVSVDIPVDELAERLTFAGLEVGEVIRYGEDWDREKIVVADVTAVRQHPDADRLRLVTVDLGGTSLEMVTGAPNVSERSVGRKVAAALVGATLCDAKGGPGAKITLKPAKIRGIRSEGMVCSERELGISEEHEGIMFLPGDAPAAGTPLRDYLGDTVLDIELTPNLSYCLSIEGVAREVHALGAGTLRDRPRQYEEKGPAVEGLVTIVVEDDVRCPRYTAAVVQGVKIGPSPFTMAHRLRLAGMRPINNIVDITNYVMWETGQPLHAFDYDLLTGDKDGDSPKIVVRTASEGERITTLDGVERTCTAEDLLICDGQRPVAVAGVMGGADTEVHDNTVNVLIESAGFDRTTVRRTAGRLKLPSEASMRFGRGVSPEGSAAAARFAADRMRVIAGGTVASGIADSYPRRQERVSLSINGGELERLLGVKVEDSEVEGIFRRLGFDVVADQGAFTVGIPPWRLDISIPADLVEEVARITGYDRIPSAPLPGGFPPPSPSPQTEAEDRIKDTLAACGLTETISYSITHPSHSVKLGLDEDDGHYLELANPLTADRTHMRRHLLPSLLETLQANLRYLDRVAIFEVARVYHAREGAELPEEPRRLGILLRGPSTLPSWGDVEPHPFEFFHLKGIVETLADRMGLEPLTFEPMEGAPYQMGRAARVLLGDRVVGAMGELDPALREIYDLPDGRVALGEFHADAFASGVEMKQYRQIYRQPVLYQDIALDCPEETPAARVAETLRRACGRLLVDLELFDVYRGDQVGEGRKSLAYNLLFQAPDRSLTEKEVNKIRDKAVKVLEKELDAKLR